MTDAERMNVLRTRCLNRKQHHCCRGWIGGSPVTTAESLRASEATSSWQIRCGLATRDRLSALPFAMDELELLAGRIDFSAMNFDPQAVAKADEYLASYPTPGGQTGHCELDRSRAFEVGLDQLRAELRRRAAAGCDAQAVTWQSFILGLDGLSCMIEHAAGVVETAMPNASPARHAELTAIARSCRRVAHQRPGSFRDGLQLLWFIDLAVMHADRAGLVGPGHIDRSLHRFYQEDIAAGVLSREEALLLIESLYILINDFVPDGLAMACMVGGRDETGNDVTNELSYLCLEALRRTRLIYPTVGICRHQGTPDELVDLGVQLVAQGISTPAFFGDETIQKGLKDLGLPPEEASHYVNSTCVEITPVGCSNVWVASPYFNLCGILLDEMADWVERPRAGGFNEFLGSYGRRLAREVDQAAAAQNELREQRQCSGGKPLQSVFTRDCVVRGLDIDRGGARHNWIECSFVGLANLADSLHVLRTEVFDGGDLGLAELKEALDSDFAQDEPLRLRLLHGHPKYGNDCPEVDELLDDVVGYAQAACRDHRMKPDDSRYVPGAFCWVMHERLGRECGATPDGRHAGFPFADGCGPAQGRETKGPTAAILSTTSWNHSPMIGGLAYNMKFNRSLFDSSESISRLGDLIRTFLRRGGFETQVNVVDHEMLRRARENPEEYRDLVVRIGGYTDYFVRLSPQMQAEVMARTEFDGV